MTLIEELLDICRGLDQTNAVRGRQLRALIPQIAALEEAAKASAESSIDVKENESE